MILLHNFLELSTQFSQYEHSNALMVLAFHASGSLYAANIYKGTHSQFDQKNSNFL